tara:strand:- start:332 stop:496 length:165 start_codon:yes stop_codon:yes gene_type:complete
VQAPVKKINRSKLNQKMIIFQSAVGFSKSQSEIFLLEGSLFCFKLNVLSFVYLF